MSQFFTSGGQSTEVLKQYFIHKVSSSNLTTVYHSETESRNEYLCKKVVWQLWDFHVEMNLNKQI